LTHDPFPGLLLQPSTLHPYLYALNNPLLFTDPSGYFICYQLASNQERCLVAVIGGVSLAVPLLAVNVALVVAAVKIALLTPPVSVLGELALLPAEGLTFEADMLVVQLISQGASRKCSEIKLNALPPYEFGP
jgi:hypothetical protein